MNRHGKDPRPRGRAVHAGSAPRTAAPAAPLSRRALLAAAAGGLAGGAGIALLGSRFMVPPAPLPAKPAPAPPPAPSAAADTSLAALPMEEEPLAPEPYIPPVPARVAAAHAPAVPRQPAVADVTPTWLRNARPLVEGHGKPLVAVVIDDLGMDHPRTRRAIALHRNATLAFLTYAERLEEWTGLAREAAHELLVHVPMQPESARFNPGPKALLTSLTAAGIRTRLRWGLDRLEGYVGANNHMGSLFTEDEPGMDVVMDEIRSRSLLFLDSRTTAKTVCGEVAAARGVPFASRNVFLDNHPTPANVRRQLATLVEVAHRHGSAIGIGHPHDATLEVLAQWLPAAHARGIVVAPLTSVMRHAGVAA